MAQWQKEDSANGAPNYLTQDEIDNSTYLVDKTEAQVDENRAKGLVTPGWVKYNTYEDSNGNTRHKSEVLIPMKVEAADVGDDGTSGDTATEDQTVADS